jgi:hypothetical protein
MDIILTESQYLKILKENKENQIERVFSDSKSFVKKITSQVKKQFGIDFTFLLTWGSVIGGFVKPVHDYMEGRYPNLTESELSLICFGIMLTYFSSNKEKLNEVLLIIKEKKIVTFFDQALSKTYDLKESFFGFISSLNVTFSKVSNMLSYTFLVPLIPTILELSKLNLNQDQIHLIVMGMSHYLGGLVGSTIITSLVEKMIERFKSKD